MKKIILITALSLATGGAFALDSHLSGSDEYYQSPLTDHGPGSTTETIGVGHDHGDDTIRNFTGHDHDMPVVDKPASSSDGTTPKLHDHGDDVIKEFIPHVES